MANLDTPAKRLSSLDFEEVWEVAAPIPDGAISQADRQHSIWTYAGILIVAVVSIVVDSCTVADAALYSATLTDAALYSASIVDTRLYSAEVTDG